MLPTLFSGASAGRRSHSLSMEAEMASIASSVLLFVLT